MRNGMQISAVRLVPAPPELVQSGLLAWASCTVGASLRLDGITLRRALDGRTVVSYPARRDGAGRDHAYFMPLDEGARREIEARLVREAHEQGLIERVEHRATPRGTPPTRGQTRPGPAGSSPHERPSQGPRRGPPDQRGSGPRQSDRREDPER